MFFFKKRKKLIYYFPHPNKCLSVATVLLTLLIFHWKLIYSLKTQKVSLNAKVPAHKSIPLGMVTGLINMILYYHLTTVVTFTKNNKLNKIFGFFYENFQRGPGTRNFTSPVRHPRVIFSLDNRPSAATRLCRTREPRYGHTRLTERYLTTSIPRYTFRRGAVVAARWRRRRRVSVGRLFSVPR